MGVYEILIIIACSAIVIGVISKSIIDKKKGKSSCDCCSKDCSHCPISQAELKELNNLKITIKHKS